MQSKLKDLTQTLKIIFRPDNSKESTNIEFYGSIFFTFVSVVLTIVNVAKGQSFMTYATTVLAIGFVVDALLAKKNKPLAYKLLMVLLCGVMFTIFALTGGNDGFAILWILLVPLIGTLLVGMHMGFMLSLYFLIFLIVIFYTPLKANFAEYYTDTFMLRFPLLYLAAFGSTLILIIQKQKLNNRINHQANHDALTGLYNRHYYNHLLKQPHADTVAVISVDINGLKKVNDEIGHEAGDEIIKATAELIRKIFKGDACCRVGGDEFIVLSETDFTESKVEELINGVKNWHGRLVDTLSVSVGFVQGTDGLKDIDSLIREADKEMYKNKKSHYDNLFRNV